MRLFGFPIWNQESKAKFSGSTSNEDDTPPPPNPLFQIPNCQQPSARLPCYKLPPCNLEPTTMSAQVKSSSPPSSASSASSLTMDDTLLDRATAHVHESIKALLADEVPDLAESKGLLVFNDPYLQLTMKSFKLYLNFIWTTWTGVIASVKPLLNKQMALLDFVTLLFFSALVSVVLTMGVVVCLACKLPLVENVFGLYSRLNGGFSFINSCTRARHCPNLSLTSPSEHAHVFVLDQARSCPFQSGTILNSSSRRQALQPRNRQDASPALLGRIRTFIGRNTRFPPSDAFPPKGIQTAPQQTQSCRKLSHTTH